MGILESIISVVGTLIGVLAGFLISYYFELRRRKHESMIEYRKVIKEHMDDIIKPLFIHLQNLWGSLAVLQVSLGHKSSIARGKTLKDLVLETQTANQELKKFVNSKYDEMSFILPSPFPWVFAPFDELVVSKIIEPILHGKEPIDDITLAVNTAMGIQKNLRRLIGFEIDVEIESIYPFKKPTNTNNGKDADEEREKHLPRKKSSKNRTEEIRGLFVLGLLAVLASIRIQQSEMMVDIGQISLDMIPFLDITMIFWALYAFCMVLGLSEDVIGKTISNFFRETSRAFLGVNFILLIFFSSLAFYAGFPTRLPWALVLIFILALYGARKRIRKPRKSLLKLDSKKVKSYVLSLTLEVLKVVIALGIMLTIFVSDEQQVILYFIVGLVAITMYITIKEKVKD